MKTSTKVSIISGVALVALVGTGFAAWTFNKTATADKGSNVVITTDTSVGTLVVENVTVNLILDQGSLAWGTYDSTEDSITTVSSLELTYTGSASLNDVTGVTISVAITNGASSYVTLDDGSFDSGTCTNNVKVWNYTLPTITWVDGQKPTTQSAFDTMESALASATVTFAFTATVAA